MISHHSFSTFGADIKLIEMRGQHVQILRFTNPGILSGVQLRVSGW
jgi:hypothetical protein